MTADAFKAALEKSKAAGMSDYLTKPLDPKKIREVLASIKA
jgi:CheY-like chemotaxis protein